MACGLALGACGGGDAKTPPASSRGAAAGAGSAGEPTPAAMPALEPLATRPDRPQLRVLDPGAQPRRHLIYTPTPGEHAITLTLASTLALDMGIAAIPPTRAPALRMRLKARTRRRPDGDFVLALAPSRVETVVGEGSGALAARMDNTIAALEHLEAELVLANDGALLETSIALPPTPGSSGPTEAERLQNAFAQLFVPLPADPVGVGARWTATQTLPFAGSRIRQTSTFTLVEIDDELATVELALEQAPDPDGSAPTPSTPPAPAGATRTTLDALKTTGTGRLELDLRRFGPRAAHSTSHSEVTQTIERDGQRQQVSMTLDLTLDAESS